MSRLSKIIRWILPTPIILLFFVVALIGIPAAAITGTVSRSETAKEYLQKSGVYGDTLEILLGLLAQSAGAEGGNFFKDLKTRIMDPQSEPGKIARKITDPAAVRQKAETVIDATYAWMEGKTERPVFEITLLDNQNDFLGLLSLGFREKARSLPACGAGYRVSKNFNPLETPCWPQALPLSEIDRFLAAHADIKEFDSLFARAKFDSRTLEIPRETTEEVQRIFPWVQSARWIIFGTLAGLGILLLILIPRFLTATKIVGALLLLASLLTLSGRLIAGARSNALLNAVTHSMSAEGQTAFLPAFEKIFGTLFFGFLNAITFHALITAGLGIALILAAVLIKSGQLDRR